MATKVIGIESAYSSAVVEIPFNGKEGVVAGDEVIFKNEEDHEEYGLVKYVDEETSDKNNILFASRILRKATANDIQKVDNMIAKAEQALETCRSLAKENNVKINVFRCGYSFDGEKVHFMFTSDDRVDFRDLVKALAKTLKKQIHLRQIGPRDKAKLIGGYGKCGRELCCSTWMGKLESINMEMVRVQGLENKGSSKLSGTCGKLLCCLKYEIEAYKDLRKGMPRLGSKVMVGKNEGKVIALDILNRKLKVVLGNNELAHVKVEEISKI